MEHLHEGVLVGQSLVFRVESRRSSPQLVLDELRQVPVVELRSVRPTRALQLAADGRWEEVRQQDWSRGLEQCLLEGVNSVSFRLLLLTIGAGFIK